MIVNLIRHKIGSHTDGQLIINTIKYLLVPVNNSKKIGLISIKYYLYQYYSVINSAMGGFRHGLNAYMTSQIYVEIYGVIQ